MREGACGRRPAEPGTAPGAYLTPGIAGEGGSSLDKVARGPGTAGGPGAVSKTGRYTRGTSPRGAGRPEWRRKTSTALAWLGRVQQEAARSGGPAAMPGAASTKSCRPVLPDGPGAVSETGRYT